MRNVTEILYAEQDRLEQNSYDRRVYLSNSDSYNIIVVEERAVKIKPDFISGRADSLIYGQTEGCTLSAASCTLLSKIADFTVKPLPGM